MPAMSFNRLGLEGCWENLDIWSGLLWYVKYAPQLLVLGLKPNTDGFCLRRRGPYKYKEPELALTFALHRASYTKEENGWGGYWKPPGVPCR